MPFNTLISDREPFLLVEQARISVSGNSVVVKRKDGISNVPVSSIHCLMLGAGTSITSDAAAMCAKHNCYIAFVRGIPIGLYFYENFTRKIDNLQSL